MQEPPQSELPSPLLPALDALRGATAPHHRRIEALVDLAGPFGRAHYAQVLQGFALFLAGWEPRIAQALPQRLQAWFGRGRRHGLVQRDLDVLGVASPAGEATLPAIGSLAQAIGSLYVLEGSALGGQVIAANLRRRLGIGPDDGAAYFTGCGRGTAARWREFRELAAAELDGDAQALHAAVDAAQRTFEALIATFQECLNERATA